MKQARATRNIEDIVQGAGIVFSKRSFSAATVEEVATASGVGIGSLYFHFGANEHLARTVIQRQHAVDTRAA